MDWLAFNPMNILSEAMNEFVGSLVGGFVDALIWLFHTALMKPLVKELFGNFMINESMLDVSSSEIIGLILNYCYQKMLIIGIAILMLIAMWQLFKNFFSYFGQTQSEEGWKIGAKIILYGILILNAKGICKEVIYLSTGVMQGISSVSASIKEANLGNQNVIFTGIATVVGTGNETLTDIMNDMGMYTYQQWTGDIGTTMKQVINRIYFVLENMEITGSVQIAKLVQFVIIILIDVKLIKLAINMAEKYMNVVLMIIISPIAFACGVSKSTNKIFTKWVSLFTSGVLYQLLQYLVLAMLYYIVNNIADTNTFKVLLIIWSVLSMAENADALVDELGFSALGQGAIGVGNIASAANMVSYAPVSIVSSFVPGLRTSNDRSGKGASVKLNNGSSSGDGASVGL